MSETEQLELAMDAVADSKPAAKKAATKKAAPKKAAAKKPAAKKTTKATKAAGAEASEVASDQAAQPIGGEPAKPVRRTRKVAAKSAAGTEATGDVEAAAAGEQEKKTPARRTRKKLAEAAAGEPAEGATSEPAGEEANDQKKAPARRIRLRSKVSGDADAAADGADKAAGTAKAASAADDAAGQAGVDGEKQGSGSNGAGAGSGSGSGSGSNNGSNNGSNGGKNGRHNRHQRNQQREIAPSVTKEELEELKISELRAKADELELDHAGMKKPELVEAVYAATMKAEGFIEVVGILDILQDGYGFLRTQGYLPSESDCYVGTSLIRRNNLRKGDMVRGQTRPPRPNEKYAAIQKIISINDVPLEEMGRRIKFGDLTPVYPDECLIMEHGKNTITARVIDLVSPIGKGQRGLIVSPPKAGVLFCRNTNRPRRKGRFFAIFN